MTLFDPPVSELPPVAHARIVFQKQKILETNYLRTPGIIYYIKFNERNCLEVWASPAVHGKQKTKPQQLLWNFGNQSSKFRLYGQGDGNQ